MNSSIFAKKTNIMETFQIIWNWSLLVVLIVLVGFFALDLWRLYHLPPQEGDKAQIIRLSIRNRWLYLVLAVLLIVSRLDRMCL